METTQKHIMTTQQDDLEKEALCLTTDFLESLGIDLVILSDKLPIKEARDYLLFGVARRLSIIRINLCDIFEIAYPSREAPLGLLGESAYLSMHLHSFFYHCYGALDNAAWCLAYGKGFLKHGCDWNKCKRDIGFYEKKKYSDWLEEHHSALWKVLQKQKTAHEDMRNIRDAIAHRIPLYVPSAITPAQQEKQLLLYRQAEQVGLHDSKYFSLKEQADTMGYFLPWFYVEGDSHPKYNVRSYPLKVAQHLLAILSAVKDELTKGSAP